MTVKYKNKGQIIVHSKGMTRTDIINLLDKRIHKRDEELTKRAWIVREYNSIKEKQDMDIEWLNYLKSITDETWNNLNHA